MKQVVCQAWIEEDPGCFGGGRYYSLHIDIADLIAFRNDYVFSCVSQCDAPDDDNKVSTSGPSYTCEVDELLFERVRKSVNGIWTWHAPTKSA